MASYNAESYNAESNDALIKMLWCRVLLAQLNVSGRASVASYNVESSDALIKMLECRVVLAQLEGSGRGSLASYNAESYDALTKMLHEEPMRDGDAWVEKLLQKNEMLGESSPASPGLWAHRYQESLDRIFGAILTWQAVTWSCVTRPDISSMAVWCVGGAAEMSV